MRARFGALVSWLFPLAWSVQAHAQYAPTPNGAPAPSAPPPSAAPASTLSSGGLAPPPAIEAAPAPGSEPTANTQPGGPTPATTEAELDRADREDSGRGLEFVWLNAEAGVMHVGLATFEKSNPYPPLAKTKETGFVAGGGAGVRLVFMTLGARFRYALMPDFKLWTLALEGGVHAPFGNFEPYATLGLGYASLGGAKVTDTDQGFDARLAAGADYFFTPMFSLGVNLSGELLVLHRSGPCPQGTGSGEEYCLEGTTTGGAVSATAVAGLHF